MLSVVLDRTWSFYGTPQGRKLVRYGLVSVVSACIGFSLLILIYGVLQLWSEVPSFSNAHHLDHVARTVVIVGANTAAFGTIWIVKFLILNRLFRVEPVSGAEVADSLATP